MLTKKQKDAIIKKFMMHDNDTGSASIQIALLTSEIELLTEHLKQHKKDFSSRRGLIKKVSARRRLLKFLRQDNEEQFESIVTVLHLRKPAAFSPVEEDIMHEQKMMEKEAEQLEKEQEKES